MSSTTAVAQVTSALIAFVKNYAVQAEVEAVTRRMNDLKLDNELKQEKLAQVLDMRAAKIKKLEGLARSKIIYFA